MNALLAVAMGGALGAVSRHSLGIWIMQTVREPFPWATCLINVAGSFAAGILLALMAEKVAADEGWRLFLVVGFLGSFTTFSVFAAESVAMISSGDIFGAASYILGSVVLSVAAVALAGAFVWKFFA